MCNKYKLSQWYPQDDVDARAKIDQALDWRQTSFTNHVNKATLNQLFGIPIPPAEQKENLALVKTDLENFVKFYIQDGKFINGCDKPTLADLSVRPPMNFLKVLDYKFPKEVQAYMDRFDKAVPSFADCSAATDDVIASVKGKKDNKKGGKKAAKEPKKKASNKGGKKKKEAEPKAAGGTDAKMVKACIKEGGKKGQDLAGMSAFGCHFFCTSFEEPKGDLKYLDLCMEGANKKVDPDAEDRKGGAGDLGKIFFSAGDKNLAMIAHLPVECAEKADLKEWFSRVCDSVGAKPTFKDAHFASAEVPADPEKDRFPLKLRDVAIAAGFAYLREKGLVLDDDSDDDINFADDCGVDLNAGAEGDY